MPALPIERSPAPPRGFSVGDRFYLRPISLLHGPEAGAAVAAGSALPLAGGPGAFAAVDILVRAADRILSSILPVTTLDDWAASLDDAAAERVAALCHALSAPRPPVAGLSMERPVLMGVVNVTPDSFSDGGDFATADAAIAHGRSLAEAGAGLIDVGGESTRPRAAPVDTETELSRILPVVTALAGDGLRVSVDTRRATIMRAAEAVGASMLNDVSALTFDPDALPAAAGSSLPIILMHAQGDPQTMQDAPDYAHAPLDVFDFLEERVGACVAAGIPRETLIVDPGIGFGKTVDHNLQILHQLSLLHGLGCPILLGVSRKSFIGRLSRGEAAKARLPGSLAAALAGLDQGVQILRVHDVAETAQALAIWEGIAGNSYCDAASRGATVPE
ncbi:MAG: dihydropteroate synthase [Rhodospirillaceae bacterium]|nr:dihydropteroate synthase [Rhodospirillaceae bacterium]